MELKKVVMLSLILFGLMKLEGYSSYTDIPGDFKSSSVCQNFKYNSATSILSAYCRPLIGGCRSSKDYAGMSSTVSGFFGSPLFGKKKVTCKYGPAKLTTLYIPQEQINKKTAVTVGYDGNLLFEDLIATTGIAGPFNVKVINKTNKNMECFAGLSIGQETITVHGNQTNTFKPLKLSPNTGSPNRAQVVECYGAGYFSTNITSDITITFETDEENKKIVKIVNIDTVNGDLKPGVDIQKKYAISGNFGKSCPLINYDRTRKVLYGYCYYYNNKTKFLNYTFLTVTKDDIGNGKKVGNNNGFLQFWN